MLVGPPKKKVFRFLKVTFLTTLVCFSVLFFSYHLAYAEKVIPGVKVVDIVLGNKSQNEVKAILSRTLDERSSQPVKLTAGEKSFEFSLGELGVSYNLDRTAAAAFEVGRSRNLVADLRTEVRAWFRGVEVAPILKIEEEKLAGILLQVAEELDDPPAEAKFGMDPPDLPAGEAGTGGELKIVEAKSGRVVDQEKLEERIFDSLKSFSAAAIKIPLEDITPEIRAAELETVRTQVEEIFKNPVRLTYQQQVFVPTGEEILTFLDFQKQDSVARVGVRNDTLSDYTKRIAAKVNRPPRGDIFQLEGGRVVEFRLASDGLELDGEEALQLLSAALLGSEKEVELPIKVSRPLRSSNDYGVRELLGQGVSNFAGSGQGRINNIKTASGRLRGILIAPGETFSFNTALGEVSSETEYDTAWVIRQGRTVLGVGGGVCQVSTTVFRAAFNSGLPILQRTAHAYRVHYYEPPLGFDATVYEPSPDLVFKNDTSGHILIWSYVDVPNTTLTFSFYGTSDGRSTKMIGPFVSGESPPPAPLYQDDPSLPKGTTQQIDFAAWGATAVVKREVYRNGKILHNDTFTSNYRPWQAVFLVGTGE